MLKSAKKEILGGGTRSIDRGPSGRSGVGKRNSSPNNLGSVLKTERATAQEGKGTGKMQMIFPENHDAPWKGVYTKRGQKNIRTRSRVGSRDRDRREGKSPAIETEIGKCRDQTTKNSS